MLPKVAHPCTPDGQTHGQPEGDKQGDKPDDKKREEGPQLLDEATETLIESVHQAAGKMAMDDVINGYANNLTVADTSIEDLAGMTERTPEKMKAVV